MANLAESVGGRMRARPRGRPHATRAPATDLSFTTRRRRTWFRGDALDTAGSPWTPSRVATGIPLPSDIDALTEAELVDLNHRIVERLRFLHQMKSPKQMLDFSIGDRVMFQPAGRPPVVGIITRYNKKTVTVVTD